MGEWNTPLSHLLKTKIQSSRYFLSQHYDFPFVLAFLSHAGFYVFLVHRFSNLNNLSECGEALRNRTLCPIFLEFRTCHFHNLLSLCSYSAFDSSLNTLTSCSLRHEGPVSKRCVVLRLFVCSFLELPCVISMTNGGRDEGRKGRVMDIHVSHEER